MERSANNRSTLRTVMVRVTATEADALHRLAQAAHRSSSNYLRVLLIEHLQDCGELPENESPAAAAAVAAAADSRDASAAAAQARRQPSAVATITK